MYPYKIGIIYKNHLSDLDCLNDILFECYKRRKTMHNLMITKYSGGLQEKTKLDSINASKQCHYLTLKSSLVDRYTTISNGEISKSFSDLQANQWHMGWIRKVVENGLLVEMPHSLIGFTSNNDVSYLNELKSSLTNGIATGHSVLVKITKLFKDKERFTTLVRTRHGLMQTHKEDVDFMVSLFKSYLGNTRQILTELKKGTVASTSLNPIQLANRSFWETAAVKVKVGTVVSVVVKQFNLITRQIECGFADDLTEALSFRTDLTGVAFDAEFSEESIQKYSPGTKLQALVLAFDPVAKLFCLTVDQKQIKVYKKNFDAKFREQSALKEEQVIKSEILYTSQWFCIVGLKAHGYGHLAFMPLFKNDFTQLNSCNASSESRLVVPVEAKIKKQQLLKVSAAAVNRLENNKDDIKGN